MSDPIGGFGDPSDVLREISDADLQILNAAGQHVAEQYGCMVTIGDDPPDFCGSGTLVRIGEQTYVATAKHLFEKLPLTAVACFWWGHDMESECVRISQIRWPSADIDVAAAPLSKNPEHAVPLKRLDLDSADGKTDLWIVSGISGSGVDLDFQTKTVSATWWTLGLCPLPPNRWPKNLARTPNRDRDLFAHYSNKYALGSQGTAMKAVDPRGLSGGGMWTVNLDSEGVWSPDSAARLIGIQCSTSGGGKWNWLRGTRISQWLEVVRDNWSDVATVITPKLQGAG